MPQKPWHAWRCRQDAQRRESGGGATDESCTTDRGQMVIVAALLIATILVGLALVLNSGIYAENLSTRETADSADPATAIEEALSEASRSMTVVNAGGYDDHDGVNESFDAAVVNWSAAMSDERATTGQIFEVDVRDRSMGWRLAQNDSARNFTSINGDGGWTLVEDVDELAGFRLLVDREALYDDPGLVDENGTYVALDNGTTEWRIYAVTDATESEVVVFGGTDDEFGGLDLGDIGDLQRETCRVERETVEVDLTTGTVGGAPCEALEFEEALSGPIDVSFVNADDHHGDSRSGGTWELLVREDANVNENAFGTPWEQPHQSPALFDATVAVTYERADLRHHRTPTVLAEPLAYDATN